MGYSLALNPGSTSTKIGVFEGESCRLSKTIQHPAGEISRFENIVAQKDFRAAAVLETLNAEGVRFEDIDGIIAIGGLIYPCDSGVYRVSPQMVEDLAHARFDEHASNLGALIGWDFAQKLKIEAYIADPVTTDEMQEVARISGMPEIRRSGRCHTLNQKSMARRAAAELGIAYEQARFVVAHLGGGISVTAHREGRMVDTSNPRGEGPFCIDRTGGLNSFALAKLCFSGKFDKKQMLKKINGEGGVVAYLNTRDFRDVTRRRAEGDALAQAVFDALAYQAAKEIAAMTVPLGGKADAIILTGGMANSKELVGAISEQVKYLGRIMIYPGENELEALALYLHEVKTGRRAALEYKPE